MDVLHYASTPRHRSAPLVRAARPAAWWAAAALMILPWTSASHGATATDLVIRATVRTFEVGTVGTYTITVTNSSGGTADDVITIRTTLPTGLGFASSRGTGWTCSASGQAVACTNPGPLALGSTSDLVLAVSVNDNALPSVQTTLTLFYAGDTNSANNSVTKNTSVRPGRGTLPTSTPNAGTPLPTNTSGPAPTHTQTSISTSTRTPVPAVTDLSLGNNTAAPFVAGQSGTYVLTVSNVGGATTNGVITVTDFLPTGLGFISGTGIDWTCAASGQIVTCTTAAPLPAASSTIITLTVNVTEAAFPGVTNTATVTYAGDNNATNDLARKPTTVRLRHTTARTATPAPSGAPVPTSTPTPTGTPVPQNAAQTDLSISKTASGRFFVGSTGLYVLTVYNVGPVATNDTITVEDDLPNGLGFESASGNGWTCSAADGAVVCTYPDPLVAGASTSITLAVSVATAAAPTVTNTATVTYAGDTNPANNLARRPTTVRQ
jgi:large repetitive protein